MRSPTACRRRARWRPALLALALLAPLGARVAGQHPEIEQRIGERWRWRALESPDPRAPSFRLVRPWRGGGLIAVDDGGLAIFDGYEWSRPPGAGLLQVGDVFDILPVPDGLFVICDGSLISIDEAGRVLRLAELPRPNRLMPAFRRPDGSALTAVGDQILELRTVAEGPRLVATAPPGAHFIHSIAVDTDGSMWAVTDAGLFRDLGGTWKLQHASGAGLARSQRFVRAVPAAKSIYFLPESLDDASQARMWDEHELRLVRQAENSVTVIDAASCPDGALVLAQNSPMLQIVREGVGRIAFPALPSGDKLRSLCFTAGGRLAVVSGAGELWLAELAAQRWETFNPGKEGANELVNALAPASGGGLWVGTHLGLARFDGQHFTDVQVEAGDTGIVLRGLTALAEDAQGRLWVGSGGTFRGALCLEDGRWTQYCGPDDVGDRYVHAIKRIGDELWFVELDDDVGPFQRGQLVRLRDGVFTPYTTVEGGAPFTRCYDLVARPDGSLLAGTATGVFALEDGAWRPIDVPPLRTNRAFALHPRRDGGLWIGFGLDHRGVIEVREGVARRFEEGDWERAAAASFCETLDGRLWFASENGLFLVSEDECHEVTAGQPARNFWPMACDGKGGLWLGSMGSGLIHFQPDDHDAPRTFPAEIYFTEEGNTIASWDAADKWHTTPSEQLRFRLVLDGERISRATNWSGTRQNHEADLGPIPDGVHELLVTAVDMLGNVEHQPLLKEFTVPPPTWRSPPMLAALAALAATILVVAVVLAKRRREVLASQRRQGELAERLSVLTRRLFSSEEDERRKLSRELHDDLGQSLTSIGLDIQIVERQGTTPEGRVATGRALSTVRGALDRVREISSLLRPPVLDDLGLEQAVRTALTEFTTRSGVDGQLEIDLDDARIPEGAEGHVYRILQEALTNVARHASASTVFVTLRATPDAIDLTVKDDGSGFATADVPTAKRFGLLGMRERSELLGGEFTLETAPGAGTTIRVSIPIRPVPEVP